MPFCKYCGSAHDDDAVFCTECGKPIAKKAEPVADSPVQAVPAVSKLPQKKKSKKAAWIVGIAVASVALVVTVLFLFIKGSGNNPPPKESPTEHTTATEAPLAFSEDTAAIEAADASVVTIFCYDHEGELTATGSGFIAFDGKTVITNYHVMTSAYTCKISTNQDISYEVTQIMRYSEDHDIAILTLAKDTGLQPLKLGDSTTIKKGETVVAIGSPLGIKNTVSTGVLSGRLMELNMEVLQFTAPISSGSSGGALFDDHGNVIGITYASFVDGQNLNLAIPIELADILHGIREQPVDVSAIYLIDHPHVAYLDDYKNVPVVTLYDLKHNPKKYDGKVVRLSAYLSSWGKEAEYWWAENYWYLSEKNDISFDYESDSFIVHSPFSEYTYQTCPVILCHTGYECSKFVDDAVVLGDRIEVVAYFEFNQKGEPADPDDLEADMFWHSDNAYLKSILVWKE